jgi:Tfp pilus assembly protein PilF
VPLERIKRNFNEASFRQAAAEMEQMEEVHLATLPKDKQAAALTEAGKRYAGQGLILEGEREFQAALQVDPDSAEAHAQLALVREREGETSDARVQAEASIKSKPNVIGYLVLARLDMGSNMNSEAAANVSKALQVEPQNPAAKALKQQLEAKGQTVP